MTEFIISSILLGIGLAMDAFSVSIASGLAEPSMPRGGMLGIAGCFGAFQFAMPMAGWLCVRTVVRLFEAFQKLVPWIALILLAWIGAKMIYGAVRRSDDAPAPAAPRGAELVLAGVATSIDALSAGFALADYTPAGAFSASVIIAAVTFAICMAGIRVGKRFGDIFTGRAEIAGGAILILIGIEIFVRGVI